MRCGFLDCHNITYVDLSHFNSSSLTHIGGMFQRCYSLIYVNFSNFVTKTITNMDHVFAECFSLISVDLSNFDTSLAVDIQKFFYDCKSLKYINLKNFEQKNDVCYIYIFDGIPNNITACINKTKSPDLYQLIENMNDSYIDCSDEWFIRKKEIINNNNYSYIILKVKGTGINRIFYGKDMDIYCSKFIPPNEVYINNIKQNYIHYEYIFTQEINEIKLVWYNNINYLGCIFLNCTNITLVDFSHFNSSFIETMGNMFNGCTSLVYVNFSNFDTSNIKLMQYMFYNCISLISLNLSNFDTSNVINMGYMFYNCKNLRYINLKNFIEKQGLIYTDIFSEIPNNIIVCINKTKAPNLYQLIEKKNCSNIYCYDDWYKKQKKLIKDTNKCIDNCNDNINYKYEYNGICYNNCSYGIFLDKNDLIEKCKCENEKCLLCSDIEPIKNLCITCNELFYPIENDPMKL